MCIFKFVDSAITCTLSVQKLSTLNSRIHSTFITQIKAYLILYLYLLHNDNLFFTLNKGQIF